MVAPFSILLFMAVWISGTRLIWRRHFDGVYTTFPSMADEEDGSGSLDLFHVDAEGLGSASTSGVTEKPAMDEKLPGITLCFRGKILKILKILCCHSKQKQNFRKWFPFSTVLRSIFVASHSNGCFLIVNCIEGLKKVRFSS
jgi:hypothetical protein